MKLYWNLRKKNYYFAALELKNAIPELKKTNTELLEDDLRGSNLEFYETKQKKVPILIRFTMPFAFITLILLICVMPLAFMITGRWGYHFQWINNWFRSVGF